MKIQYSIYLNQVQKLFELSLITAEEYETIMNRIVDMSIKESGGGSV